jgi:uncharacterized protein
MENKKRKWYLRYHRYLVPFLLLIIVFDIFFFWFKEKNDILTPLITIQNPQLADSLGRFRTIHISDLHLRKFGYLEHRTVSLINRMDPDIIFVTGDLLGNGESSIPACLDFFSQITAQYGIWAVLGNSDHFHNGKYIDTTQFIQRLKKHGIQVLQNENRKISISFDTTSSSQKWFWLIGVDDPYLGYNDLHLAINGIPETDPKLLLSHSPDIIDDAVDMKIDLMLSGHTHGGQIRFPFIGPVITQSIYRQKYAAGIFNIKNITLYVNRGIGTSGIPIRLFCRPELTILSIK